MAMSTKQKTLDKVIGWFVVREDGEPSAEVELSDVDAAPESGPRSPAQPEAPARPVPPRPALPVKQAAASAGFAEVYRRAGIADEEQQRVERALGLLGALPAGVALDARRAIVGASLGAFGIPVERILETAAAELRALDGHVADGGRRSEAVLAEARARIEQLEGEIAEIRRRMAEEDRARQELAAASGAEQARVRALFAFFEQAPR
jgi:hypothetical protein